MGLSINADTALVTPRINRKTKTDMKRFCLFTKGDWWKWGKLSLKSLSSPDKNQFNSLKLNWKFDGSFCLIVYAIHAYNYLLLNQKSYLYIYCCYLLQFFPISFLNVLNLAGSGFPPFVTNYPHFFSKKKDFRQTKQFF